MGEDYQPVTRNFTFGQTVTMRCVQIPILSDNTVEERENISVQLTTESIETDSASIEINDNGRLSSRCGYRYSFFFKGRLNSGPRI